MDLETWLSRRTFHHSRFADMDRLVRLKQEQGLVISVALPSLNEEETIAKEVLIIKSELMDRHPLVDELAVIDSGSTDRTLEMARKYGADVYVASEHLQDEGVYYGKGENLWKSIYLLKGDVIVWIDADIKNIHPKFVYGLVGPILHDPEIGYVKAFYERSLKSGDTLHPTGGGRVTSILIRPLFNLFIPQLSGVIQPLSGEYAGRREILENLPFSIGYGVETGLLIDIYTRYGLNCIAQVDMDRRIHRNQPLEALTKMSFGILQTFIHRIGSLCKMETYENLNHTLGLIEVAGDEYFLERMELQAVERPPMITMPAYQKRWGLTDEPVEVSR